MSIFLYGSQFKDFKNKDDVKLDASNLDSIHISGFPDTDLSGTKNQQTREVKDSDKIQDYQLGSPKQENATVFAGSSNISIQSSTLTGAVLPLVFAMQVGFNPFPPTNNGPEHECRPCSVDARPGCYNNSDNICNHCVMVGDTYKIVDRFSVVNPCKECRRRSKGVIEVDIKKCYKCDVLTASEDNSSCDCAPSKDEDERAANCLTCERVGSEYSWVPCRGDNNYKCIAGECVAWCSEVEGGNPDTGECADLCKVCYGIKPNSLPNCRKSKKCDNLKEECKPDTGLCRCKQDPLDCPDDKPFFQDDPEFDQYCECFCTEAAAAQGLQPPRTTCDDGSGNFRFNTKTCSCDPTCVPPADPANCEECAYNALEDEYKVASKCSPTKEECKDGECVLKCPSPCDPLKCEKCMRDPLSLENRCVDQCARMAGNFECDGLGNCCPVAPSINAIRALAEECYDAMNLPGLLP